ncbi:MAG TPA: hypothetical protein VIY48_03310 [Candidatus Paceibacterota bacterium]
MFSKPVLGHSSVKITMANDQALAYAYQALYVMVTQDITRIPVVPEGYSYQDMNELLDQALAWSKILWTKPVEYEPGS